MTIKIVFLKSGETLIADLKEIYFETEAQVDSKNYPSGYILKYPCSFETVKGYHITDESLKDKRQVLFHPWPSLSKNESVVLPLDWVVTAVDPIDSIAEIYQKNVLKEN
jgi:hypothetical protein